MPLPAQQRPADITELSLPDLLNTPISTASRFSQSSMEAPASVTVVTREQIQRSGYRTLADILRGVQGFYITYDRQYSYVGVRGFSNPGDYNTRILLMVDGHRLNDTIFEQAMVGTEFTIDVDLIDHVEITRGPASSLYGTNAVFGVINVITRKARDLNGVEAASDAGSFNTYRGRLSYGREIAGIQTLLSGTFYGSQGPKRLYYPEYDDPSTNNGMASHADDDQFIDLLATLSRRGLRFQAAYNAREKGDPTGAFGDVFNDRRNREADAHGYLDLRYERSIGNSSSLLVRTYFDRYMYDGKFVRQGDNGRVLNKDFGRGESFGMELQSTTRLRDRYRFVSGFEYRNDFRQEVTNYDVSPFASYLKYDHPTFVAAPYIESEIPLRGSFLLAPSIRVDYNPRVGWMTSPRLAFRFSQGDRDHFKLVFGQSFRSPNAYELYYYPAYTSSTLRAERNLAWEGNWDREFSRGFFLSTALYANRMRNFIVTNEASTLGFENEGKMDTAGLETTFQKKWLNGATAILGYSNTFQQLGDDGEGKINSPKHLGKLNASIPLRTKKVFATIDAQYIGRRATLAQNTVSPYTTLNFTLLGRDIFGRLDLSASLYNALDKTFYDPGAEQHRQDALRQDGRSFRVKLIWHGGGR
ncbi:TonB-dependent receptor plug domain-containing protein [Terriglobus albidus]|uniref:TonB-dependent receptor plug domain-containing protein n=1 Tax=Terriglobus albidus TaxID=1592106 RepID=UPI0021E0CCAD|nr:TonB-dependent receptor [Terriglobus albidus]